MKRKLKMNPTFPIGRVVATPGVLTRVSIARIIACTNRHGARDWGDVSEGDRLANDLDVDAGGQLLSVYPIDETQPCGPGNKLWVITEGDRSVTTVLLPEEH